MNSSPSDPSDEYRRIVARLDSLIEHVTNGFVDISFGSTLNSLVNRSELVTKKDMTEFLLAEEDQSNMGNARSGSRPYYSVDKFQERAHGFRKYLTAIRSDFMQQPVLGKTSITKERTEILAALVDAYLSDPERSTFHFMSADNRKTIFHPGLPGGSFVPPWSHIASLAHENVIDIDSLNGKAGDIYIRTAVIDRIERGESNLLRTENQNARVEALANSKTVYNITTNVHGGRANIANASAEFDQTIVVSIPKGDKEALDDALNDVGLSASEISEISKALTEDEQRAGKPSFGERTQLLVGKFAARTGESVAVGMISELIKQYVGLQ